MILCIAEKPSMGRDIARVLGATHSHDGYMEGNGYCVSWTFGHLCALLDPNEYNEQWKGWNMSSLPMVPERFGIKVTNDKVSSNSSTPSNPSSKKPKWSSTVAMLDKREN